MILSPINTIEDLRGRYFKCPCGFSSSGEELCVVEVRHGVGTALCPKCAYHLTHFWREQSKEEFLSFRQALERKRTDEQLTKAWQEQMESAHAERLREQEREERRRKKFLEESARSKRLEQERKREPRPKRKLSLSDEEKLFIAELFRSADMTASLEDLFDSEADYVVDPNDLWFYEGMNDAAAHTALVSGRDNPTRPLHHVKGGGSRIRFRTREKAEWLRPE